MPSGADKILPRNVAALRQGAVAFEAPVRAAGNPAGSLLQSGVGNCFPGLECDLRNLERRFFPFFEVDTDFEEIFVTRVDIAGVEAAVQRNELSQSAAMVYRSANTAALAGTPWTIVRLRGDFGPLGSLNFALADLGAGSFGEGRLPADAWTALRLLREDTPVTLTLQPPAGATRTLTRNRTRYLDPNGALSRLFEVGELAQSLCSPWTHDFRDCGCYYWATNHPDIALPPQSSAGGQPNPDLATQWLRLDRSAAPPATVGGPDDIEEMRHHGINRDWQLLNVVLERREQVSPYVEQPFAAAPLPDKASLLTHLRYAAGVELAVMQEYLVAAWSLRSSQSAPAAVRDDLRASFAEIMRIARGEMRHLRAVNDVIRDLTAPAAMQPALQVASQIPSGQGQFRQKSFRSLTKVALRDFIDLEAPSQSVDSVYSRILVSLPVFGGGEAQTNSIRTVMAEGEDHWQTFLFIDEWLRNHAEADYLRVLQPPNAASPVQQQLQARYMTLLQTLHAGYSQDLLNGAASINTARSSMLGAAGIEGALDAVVAQGQLPTFEPISDPRFAELAPPP